jgi:quercetin dioxygenase-like cupin family protein
LRQTPIALIGGRATDEHRSPGEATLQVLEGTIKVHAGTDTAEGAIGDFFVIPAGRHSLTAVEDSAVLLSVRAES